MKMKWGLLTLAMILLLCGTAFGAMQEFPKFKIDVPGDWTASQEGPTVILVANDKSASISITVGPMEGATLEQLAQAFSKELKGSAPKAGNDGFEFTFGPAGQQSQAFIADNPDTKEYVLIAVTGENPKVGEILNSLQDK